MPARVRNIRRVVDERHATANPPSLTVVDIRHGAKSVEAIERLRSQWPAATVIAIASSAQPEQILQAMRAGANEYLAWPDRRVVQRGHSPGR
jgi:DNA-binding NarL/FixJ family response regulator